jgi:electron transport complex protein RnfD
MAITVAACLLTEGVAGRLRGRGLGSLGDGSAVVTGLILAFSLPPLLPAYMAFLGGVVAIGLGKMAFGGLGQNLFNPAMVGRAFLMASFPVAMTTWARPFDLRPLGVDAMSGATPLAAAKFGTGAVPGPWSLCVGDVGGSIGETSALAVLLGGVFLLLRRTADWRQPLGVLVGAGVFAATAHLLAPDRFADVLVQLTSGALVFGAFFIATDPVGCPLTPVGRLAFGVGVGVLVMVIRLFGGYPEGVMFAVLLMNALTPLIERWTRPEPFGGRGEP